MQNADGMWRLSKQKCIYLFTFDKLDREFAQVQHQLTQTQTTEGTARLTAAELGRKWGKLSSLSGLPELEHVLAPPYSVLC